MARIFHTGDLDPRTHLSRVDNDWIYNGLDAAVTLEIAQELRNQCDEVSQKTYEMSMALEGPVLEMTLRGILVDQETRRALLQQVYFDLERVEENLYMILEKGLDIPIDRKAKTKYWRSNKQIQILFYEALGLKPIKKRNAKGGFSPTVNEDALDKLSVNFYAEPLCSHILALRDLDKKRQLLETDLDEDSRLRSTWNIAGTNTGRFSSSESAYDTGRNTQNIDKRLRGMFYADDGMKLANIDLEQADARNLGAVCWNLFVEKYGEEFAGKYLDYCESGDLHTKVCISAFPELEWTGDPVKDRAIADQIAHRMFSYRDLAKRIGHGSNYDGLVNVANATKLPMSRIKKFRDNYFADFPAIPLWHDWVAEQLRTVGFITTLFGRRRYFHGRADDKNNIRAAIAYEPQSCTGDEINHGLINLFRTGRVQLLAQVHDSLLFQYPTEEEDEIIPLAIKAMTIPLVLAKGREFVVPVEAQVGWNWGERKVDKKTKTVTNPHGLIKWTGEPDTRLSPSRRRRRHSFFKELIQ